MKNKAKSQKPTKAKFSILRQICNWIPNHLVPKLARETKARSDPQAFHKLLRQRSLPWPRRFNVSPCRAGTLCCQAAGRSLPDFEVFSRHRARARWDFRCKRSFKPCAKIPRWGSHFLLFEGIVGSAVTKPMKEFAFQAGEHVVHLYCSDLDSKVFLLEAQHRGTPLGGAYSAQYHRARTNPGQNHIHVYCKNNELFALNADGTAHDQSHGVQIPNKVAKAIAQKFPNIHLPPENLIECASIEDEAEVLLESPTDRV